MPPPPPSRVHLRQRLTNRSLILLPRLESVIYVVDAKVSIVLDGVVDRLVQLQAVEKAVPVAVVSPGKKYIVC